MFRFARLAGGMAGDPVTLGKGMRMYTEVLFALVYLFTSRRILFGTNYQLLINSLSFFATAVALDVFKSFDYYLDFF